MSAKSESEKKATRRVLRTGFKPKLGGRVRLWNGPGLWSVCSKGGGSGTWFIQPVCDEARAACADPSSLTEVAENVWSYAIEVKTNQMGLPAVVEAS